jgi:hypothetical protein
MSVTCIKSAAEQGQLAHLADLGEWQATGRIRWTRLRRSETKDAISRLHEEYLEHRHVGLQMPRTLRLPGEAELPPGAGRRFAEALFRIYRAAHRPTLRQISAAISSNQHLAGTASAETVRRVLLGKTVPSSWTTVEAVFVALAELAGYPPDFEMSDPDDPWAQDPVEWRIRIERLWHEALDSSQGDEREEPPF